MKWNWLQAAGAAGDWGKKREGSEGKEKSRSLLWWVTLTCSRCAQCQSIRHPALLLMSTGNKSEQARLYFAAWVTCWSRHEPMCPSLPSPQLTSPRLTFTRWESLPLFSLFLSISSIHYADSLFFFFCQSLVFIWFFIYFKCFLFPVCVSVSVCICALDKLRNTEGINHCHIAAQLVAQVLLQTFLA